MSALLNAQRNQLIGNHGIEIDTYEKISKNKEYGFVKRTISAIHRYVKENKGTIIFELLLGLFYLLVSKIF